MNRPNLTAACKTLHLAFRNSIASGHLDPEEIYGILTSLLLRVASQYDPHYNEKIEQIVKIINDQLTSSNQFSAGEIRRHLDFDCDRHCGMLCRRGFLTCEVKGSGIRYERNPGHWPPPASFFNAGPVGFTYYLSTWFRYALQQYINNAMSELEAKEGVYSLEGYLAARCEFSGSSNPEDLSLYDPGRPDDPDLGRTRTGKETGGQPASDVSGLNPAWVAQTDNPLFAHLTPNERHLLYLYFAREMDFTYVGPPATLSRCVVQAFNGGSAASRNRSKSFTATRDNSYKCVSNCSTPSNRIVRSP